MFSVQLSSVLQQTKKTCTVSTVLPSIFFSTTYSIPIRVHLHVKLHVCMCVYFSFKVYHVCMCTNLYAL